MTRATTFLLLLIVQALCALVFLLDILMSIFRIYPAPLSWSVRELMEMGAGVGLLLGLGLGAVLVLRSFKELHRAEARLEKASAAFVDLLNARFDEWGLTEAERDVAMFAIKGLSVQEMAKLRETSEGTVKSQTAAIYRKANVTGRPQLLSLFIEDMMGAEGGARGSASGLSNGLSTPSTQARTLASGGINSGLGR
jgi:DNA-binding CsgD family transcriptional regulator